MIAPGSLADSTTGTGLPKSPDNPRSSSSKVAASVAEEESRTNPRAEFVRPVLAAASAARYRSHKSYPSSAAAGSEQMMSARQAINVRGCIAALDFDGGMNLLLTLTQAFRQ
jgi:hypothetical protein